MSVQVPVEALDPLPEPPPPQQPHSPTNSMPELDSLPVIPPPHPQQPQSPTSSVPEPLPAQSSNILEHQADHTPSLTLQGEERKLERVGVLDCLMHKNRLQEYTQKNSLQLPVYHSVNEGAQHAPKYRSTILVDGISYTSQETFPQRKSAEQDAARIALENIRQKLRDEGYAIILEDTTFCKCILNEYAVKMHLKKPSYQTIQSEGLLPVFVSSLDFNGVSYKGDTGRNKKEAEQLAARVVILSILDSAGSESENIMCGIIKSKFKLYAAVNKIKDPKSFCSAAISAVNAQEDSVHQLNKRKETEVDSSIVNLPSIGISDSSCELAKIQAAHLPLHQFKKPKPETAMEVVPCPIDFVPPGSGQAVVATISGAQRRRKNKKKAKAQLQIGSEMPVAIVPVTEITPSASV